MLGFSIPKLLLLFIILFTVWSIFKYFENKAKSKVEREKKSKFDHELLTECLVCGGYYDKSINNKCPICADKFKK